MQHHYTLQLIGARLLVRRSTKYTLHILGQDTDKTRPVLRRFYDSRRPTPDALTSTRAHANKQETFLAARMPTPRFPLGSTIDILPVVFAPLDVADPSSPPLFAAEH